MTPQPTNTTPTTPLAELSSIQFPAGPTYADLLGGSADGISWVRYKVWSADWYVQTIELLAAALPDLDRHVGLEMAIDGLLGALSGAFDAAVGLLIENAEAELDIPEAARTPPHLYGWPRFETVTKNAPFRSWDGVADLVTDVDAALEGEKDEIPTGWLAGLRRARNRTMHQHSLPRTWESDDHGGTAAVSLTGFPSDAMKNLRTSCDQTSDLTERMVALANSLGWIGPRSPLPRTRLVS